MVKTLILFFLITGVTFAADQMLGDNDCGGCGNYENYGGDQLWAINVVTAYTLVLDSALVYVYSTSSADSIHLGIYSNLDGSFTADDLIDSCAGAAVQVQDAATWFKADYVNGATVNAGDTLWLAAIFKETGAIYYYYNATAGVYKQATNGVSVWDVEDWQPGGGTDSREIIIITWGHTVEGGIPKRIIYIGED